MRKLLNQQSGFSMVEVMIGAALAGGLALVMVTMYENQNKALRAITAKNEAQAMRNVMYEILRSADNCVASMKTAKATPPDMTQEIDIPRIVATKSVSGGTYQFSNFYEVGKTYGGGLVKIASMKVRPQTPQDETPGHKFIVQFELTGDITGAKQVTKKMEFSFDNTPTTSSPTYAYSCVAGIIGSSVPRCRVCVQIADSGCSSEIGAVQCSPWVTKPNVQEWSNWASDSNYYDPDCTRVALECQ